MLILRPMYASYISVHRLAGRSYRLSARTIVNDGTRPPDCPAAMYVSMCSRYIGFRASRHGLRTMPLHAPRVQNWIFGRRGIASRNLSGTRAVIGSLANKAPDQSSLPARETPRLIVKKKQERLPISPVRTRGRPFYGAQSILVPT